MKAKPARNDAAVKLAIIDVAVGSRILANEKILDAFGHVSVRHPTDPNRYFMGRSLAPSLMTPADVVELDLDSNPVNKNAPPLFLERFIHGEIYKRRPDVMAVVHTHSPTTIPFGVTGNQLRPICHMTGFLLPGVPVFDIRDFDPESNMLIRNPALGAAHAETLADKPMTLMRGHGNVVTGLDVRNAVYRAIYCELNARLQLECALLGGEPRFLNEAESKGSEQVNIDVIERPWKYWVSRAGCESWYPKASAAKGVRKPASKSASKAAAKPAAKTSSKKKAASKPAKPVRTAAKKGRAR
jgi:ribulose-5-phosphate 4-epimerase/fuculose-1-phosphate aldolase